MTISASSSSTNSRLSRSGRPKLVVILKLSPKLLSSSFDGKGKKSVSPDAGSGPGFLKGKEKESSPPLSSPDLAARQPSVDNASDSTPTPINGTTVVDQAGRKGAQAKAGTKRAFNQAGDNLSKARGRAGQRKRPKIEDGTAEPKPPAAGHRLGPKANTGAINAGLRALDRSGAPCRRWERKPLQLKSFTGIHWQLPSWRAPVQKEGSAEAETVDSDSKANHSVSGASGDGDFMPLPQMMIDSPSSAIAMTA